MSQAALNQLICITAVAALCQILNTVAEQQCGGESSIYGMMLRRHTFHKMKTNDAFECLQVCNTDVRCQSFNYVMSKDICEMNNRTKEARIMDFVPNEERYYMKRDAKRAPLGSIPELPAQSCYEIKSSEGESVSGKYWLNSIVPRNAVLAHCDMKTNDIDECSASIPVCDANANCKNNVGSFTCTCKSGFSGDGKRCTDKDECSASIPVCDANANCNNTQGSFACTCKSGFSGDGKHCTDIDECSASIPACDANVNCKNNVGSFTCTCKSGYSGDGKRCTDIDECTATSHFCHQNADCKNTLGSHTCACKAGVSGDGETCPSRLGVIQKYTVPKTGLYTIKAGGARGGRHSYNDSNAIYDYSGGKGAVRQGTFSLSKGTVLNIVVGQRGGNSVEVWGGQATIKTAAELGLSVEDNAGTGGGGGSFVYTEINKLLLAAGGGGGASAGYDGADGQNGPNGTSSLGTNPSHVRKGGTGGQPGECNHASASYHGGVGAGWHGQDCPRAGTEHGEQGGSRVQGWVGGQAGGMNSGYNGGPVPGAVGGFGGGGGGSEDNGASGGGGGYSGGGSGTYEKQAGGGGGSYCDGSNCIGVTGGNRNDNGFVMITEK